MNVFDLARQCNSYSEYKMKAEIYGLKPEDEKTYEANNKGIMFCPFVPVQISEDFNSKNLNIVIHDVKTVNHV